MITDRGEEPEIIISAANIWEEPANTNRDMAGIIQKGRRPCRPIIPYTSPYMVTPIPSGMVWTKPRRSSPGFQPLE